MLDKNECNTLICSVCGKDITSYFNNGKDYKAESAYLVCGCCREKAKNYDVYKNDLGNIFPYKITSDLEAAKIIDKAFPSNVLQYKLMFYKSTTEQINGEKLSRALKYARAMCRRDSLIDMIEWARNILRDK